MLTTVPHVRIAGRSRAFHDTTADFVKRGVTGEVVTSKVPISIGDPGEAFVLIPPEVGRAFDIDNALDDSLAVAKGSVRSALSFFHDTQLFAHGRLAKLYLP